jgi:hypothetical protein
MLRVTGRRQAAEVDIDTHPTGDDTMKTMQSLAIAALCLTGLAAPALAAFSTQAPGFSTMPLTLPAGTFDKRSKQRVPGGSGCDDPRDIIEHPECAR